MIRQRIVKKSREEIAALYGDPPRNAVKAQSAVADKGAAFNERRALMQNFWAGWLAGVRT